MHVAFQKHRQSLVLHYALLVLQMGILLLEIQFHFTWQYIFLADEEFSPELGLYLLPALETIPEPLHGMYFFHQLFDSLSVYHHLLVLQSTVVKSI